MNNSNKLLDLPRQSLPRERLINEGRHALSAAELIAIFLRTGLPGKNVLKLAQELIEKSGSLELLAEMEAKQIAALCRGIGLVKAATLSAAFELGLRAYREPQSQQIFKSSESVYDYLSGFMRWLDKETVFVMLLNAKCKLIKVEEISRGTISTALSHPRDVIRPAVIYNAHSFIMAHNHPSGDPNPSALDDELTEQVKAAAEVLKIKMRDHIIIGDPTPEKPKNYFSYMRQGRL